MLKPNLMLNFNSNQFFQAEKYKKKLKKMNMKSMRIFFLILAFFYLLQTVLHFTCKEGLVYTDNYPAGQLPYTEEVENRRFGVLLCYSLVLFVNVHIRSLVINSHAIGAFIPVHSTRKIHLLHLLYHPIVIKSLETVLDSRLRKTLL